MVSIIKPVFLGVAIIVVLVLCSSIFVYADVLRKVDTQQNVLYLTFDDGPGPNTEQILAILAKENVSATFFVVGKRAEQYPLLVRRMVLEGHVVGTHSYSHPYLLTNVSEELRLGKLAATLASQEPVTLFRAPYGLIMPWTLKNAKKLDLQVVSWSCFPRDYKISTDKIVSRVTRCFEPGAIIVLHGWTHNQTVLALPQIIAHAQEAGYSFDVLGES